MALQLVSYLAETVCAKLVTMFESVVLCYHISTNC